MENDLQIEFLINKLSDKLEERKKSISSNTRIILAISDIYNARIFRKNGFNPSPLTQKLITILKDGPSFGIHSILYAVSYTNLSAVLDPSQTLNEFEVKIELCNGEGYKIFGGTSLEPQKSTPNRDNIANIKTPQTNQIQKFKIYSI